MDPLFQLHNTLEFYKIIYHRRRLLYQKPSSMIDLDFDIHVNHV